MLTIRVLDWTPVKIQELLRAMVARLSATVFVGEPACHDEAWLEASTKYAEQATITVFVLTTVPTFLRPVLCLVFPSYWAASAWVRQGVEILVPIIEASRNAEKDPDFHKPKDFLQGMIDTANDHDGHPEKLARRALIMGLASIHLTTLAAVHVIHDLCARPEHIEPLREELVQALKQDSGWNKATTARLATMDSFLKESQRLNPPSLRMITTPYCWSLDMANDPSKYLFIALCSNKQSRYQMAKPFLLVPKSVLRRALSQMIQTLFRNKTLTASATTSCASSWARASDINILQ